MKRVSVNDFAPFVIFNSLFVFLSGCSSIEVRTARSEFVGVQQKSLQPMAEVKRQEPQETFVEAPAAIESEDLPPIPAPSPVETAGDMENSQIRETKADNGPDGERMQISAEPNARIEKWIRYFTVQDRARFQRFLDRGRHYREVVESVLQENDLPPQLYYLAMIESGYRTNARSHAKAVGVWQFIAGTATRYGLRADRIVDERQDPIRATEAAAKYLRDLYNVFGSWHLAMAAYNAGEIRILRAIFKGRTRNFWELLDSGVLPRETGEYVPKFLAVVTIGENPEKYGFSSQAVLEPYPELEAIPVRGFRGLVDLSKRLSIPLAVLKKVNPQLVQGQLPPQGYEVWIPQEHAKKMDRALIASLWKPVGPQKSSRSLASSELSKIHIVKRGETLGKIAAQYKISVGHLMRMNHLKSSKINAGIRLRTQSQKYSSSRLVRYRVQKGDNLSVIARKYGTSINQLKKTNQIAGDRVFAGQRLKIRTSLEAR